MPKLKTVETKIAMIEGFEIAFKDSNGRDMRDDKPNIAQWPYDKQSKNDWTVNEWVNKKFKKIYPGFDVAVYDANEVQAKGQMKLSTIRDSYISSSEE